MSGVIFLSDNLVNDASITVTTGTANAQFPVTNIQNESPSLKFRSVGNTVVLEFDMGQTRAMDFVSLVGDPTGDFGLTAAELKTAVTNNFSGSTPINIPLSSDHNIGYVGFTEVSHRFAQLTLTGTGVYSELSNIFIGKKINITQNNLSIGSFRYGYTDKSVVRRNRYGQHFIDERNLVKFISGSIEYATKDEQETLDDMFIRHSRHEPVWMIVDQNSDGMNVGNYKLAIYGYLDRSPRWSANGGQTYTAQVRLLEAI